MNLGSFVRLLSDAHTIGSSSRRAGQGANDPIVIGEGTWIGAGATVLGGVTIGRGVVIAAGSVVTADIPDNVVAAGVPARAIRDLDD